jgi:hypothetical protein
MVGFCNPRMEKIIGLVDETRNSSHALEAVTRNSEAIFFQQLRIIFSAFVVSILWSSPK